MYVIEPYLFNNSSSNQLIVVLFQSELFRQQKMSQDLQSLVSEEWYVRMWHLQFRQAI